MESCGSWSNGCLGVPIKFGEKIVEENLGILAGSANIFNLYTLLLKFRRCLTISLEV
jgi:hypothetical protein